MPSLDHILLKFLDMFYNVGLTFQSYKVVQ